MLQRFIPTLKTFQTYLEANGLSDLTIQLYSNYYKNLEYICSNNNGELNQDIINAFISVINNTISKAMIKNIIEKEGWFDLRVPKTKGSIIQKEKRFISEDEINKMSKFLLEENRTPMFYLMLQITYHAGLRRKETLNLKANDIYWEDWQQDTDKPCRIKINWHGAKRGKERLGVLPQRIVKEIWNYLVMIKKHLPEPYFQSVIHGRKNLFDISTMGWHRKFKECARHIDKDYTLHELRFSYATSLYKRGYSIMEIKELLGHSNITTTQRYIKEDREKILLKLAEEFSNSK